MLGKLFKKPKTFEGKVIDVQIVDGFTDRFGQHNRYLRNEVTEIHGYNKDGMPITETYTIGEYRVIVVDTEGNLRQVEHYGKPFKIGSQQRFRDVAP